MKVLIIGVSAGGPSTLKELFRKVKRLEVPVVVAQHNISEHMEGFVQWLKSEIPWQVVLLDGEMKLEEGKIYIPSGGKDVVLRHGMRVAAVPSKSIVAPSIDRLFSSASKVLRENVVAMVLGGLGRDGISGAKDVLRMGGVVIIQKDAQFSYLPNAIGAELPRAMKRNLNEMVLYIESLMNRVWRSGYEKGSRG